MHGTARSEGHEQAEEHGQPVGDCPADELGQSVAGDLVVADGQSVVGGRSVVDGWTVDGQAEGRGQAGGLGRAEGGGPGVALGRRGVARGAVRAGERALAPDLARGLMLLLIVLSNTAFYLYAARHGASGWHPVEGSPVDRAVQFLMIVTLDLRVYPLFAFLFGYGMMQLYLRQRAAGTGERAAVSILRRRSLWLIVFGLLHATLLMAGDILGAYGVAGLVLGWLFIRRADRTLLVWGLVFGALTLLLAGPALWAAATGDIGAYGSTDTPPSTEAYASGEDNPFIAARTRLETGLFVTVAGGLVSVILPQFLLGFWAARRRILEEPGRHLRLLRWTAVMGITIGWLGALPAALAHVGAVDVPGAAVSETGVLSQLREVTGIPCGIGYVACFGLIAHRMSARTRQSRPVVAVAAVGKRSLSTYLGHSLLFSPILAAWGLGLGAHMSSATMALFAVGVWLVTVAAAYALERAGRRGPAEVVLRRLMYGRREIVNGTAATERQAPT
ncbi:DUF418 domain-containing protein [Actinomadura rudentiformis]|uniref:DUF418 domain-containing protein n=1 Tax=Actinomadura rudentiformis TaxID=359158 RepID=A0A6H9YJD6_9ACTN|nr:DUF418 domain-containing protein [Actinomadura rudentiformis]KAB2337989.1 DUF418 domain-containing protein [Actinomadura rudentiformis]